MKLPPAVMRVEAGTAYICAWCDAKNAAEEWAEACGLLPSHGICETHKAELLGDIPFEAGARSDAPVAGTPAIAERITASVGPSRLVTFSCRLGGRAS